MVQTGDFISDWVDNGSIKLLNFHYNAPRHERQNFNVAAHAAMNSINPTGHNSYLAIYSFGDKIRGMQGE